MSYINVFGSLPKVQSHRGIIPCCDISLRFSPVLIELLLQTRGSITHYVLSYQDKGFQEPYCERHGRALSQILTGCRVNHTLFFFRSHR